MPLRNPRRSRRAGTYVPSCTSDRSAASESSRTPPCCSRATTGVGGPSIADLVVLRRGTDAPVLRTKAGTLDEADALLRAINADLERMPVEEFLAEWGHLKP